MKAVEERVSIVMPAYNASAYIEDAIASVREQTWENWELIVIDDASADDTFQKAERLAGLDARIQVRKNVKNLGSAESRNEGVRAAKGRWIAFLDSDDAWEPDKLERQLAYAREKQAVFTFTASAFMNAEGKRMEYCLEVPERIEYRQLLKQNLISCSSVLIQRDLLLEYPMQHSGMMHEDFAVWLKILRDKPIAAYGLNRPLLIYRVSAGSSSGNKWKAARMTYRVYRHVGLSVPAAFYYWICYTKRSLLKYRHLKRQ